MLARPSQLLVLRVLYHAEEPLSGREVERRTGLSNRAAMMALEDLVACAVVDRALAGNAHLYTLNTSHYLFARTLKPGFEAEDLFWDDVRKAVRRVVVPRPLAAVATGPLSRDESLPTGRIELTMIFATRRHRIRAFQTMDKLSDVVWQRYGAEVDPILLDVVSMNREAYETLWRRIEREGILLFGTIPG